jgi:hypothetical protein
MKTEGRQGEWVTPDFILLPEEPTAQKALATALQADTLRILQRRLEHYPSLKAQHQVTTAPCDGYPLTRRTQLPTELALDIQGWASGSAIEVTLSVSITSHVTSLNTEFDACSGCERS